MKPIDIYVLTRVENENHLRRMERQLSGREYFLSIKKWEIDCLKNVADKLHEKSHEIYETNESHEIKVENLSDFYYSFQIPKLGKEFDLLRITEEYVINIELKSGNVTDEKIKKQLQRNRYYLSSLGKNIRSYTYVMDENRLVRLSNSGRLVESDFQRLTEDLVRAGEIYNGDIEKLFVEEQYILSPLTDPDKFLRREYFLTSGQNDIKKRILKNVAGEGLCFQGFTGLPGTGKTLLLYDLAMEFSAKQKVCILHFGSFPEELHKLDERLMRIDFYKCQGENDYDLSEYKAILIDEGHRLTKEYLERLCESARRRQVPVVFSYDSEDAVSIEERKEDIALLIEGLPGFVKYHLTNRIRMNGELSTFINCLMHPTKYRRYRSFPLVTVIFAANEMQVKDFLTQSEKKGCVYIHNQSDGPFSPTVNRQIDSAMATCREFDRVVMVVNQFFYYDAEGFLRYSGEYVGESPVRTLFHGLNRAKKEIILIIYDNELLLDGALWILQGESKKDKTK